MRVLVRRRGRTSLLLARGRSRGLLLHKDFRDRVEVIRAKAKLSILPDRADDMPSLSPAWTLESGLPPKADIPECWDTTVLVISGTPTDTVCSFFPRYVSKEPVSVVECCVSTFCSTDRPERPGHGSRSGTGLTGQDFEDLGACLRHYTLD